MGCGEVVNTTDFDSVIRGFKSHQPSLESLNQLVEHLIFKMLEDRNINIRKKRYKTWMDL